MSCVQSGGCPALKAVLLFMVIGDNQISIRPDCVPRTTPEYLQNLVGSKSGVVNYTDGPPRKLPGANGALGLANCICS